jgi:hypothetical protein
MATMWGTENSVSGSLRQEALVNVFNRSSLAEGQHVDCKDRIVDER